MAENEVFAMLMRLNGWLQKMMPIFTPLSLVIGVLLDSWMIPLLFLVPWLFAFMTFAGSLSMNFAAFKSFKRYSVIIIVTIAFLHIAMPLWAYAVAEILFNDPLYTLGFVLAVAVPTGVTSFIWAAVTRGNLALCLSIILIDTMLSPLVMPAIIHIVAGDAIHVDLKPMMLDLFLMVVLPSILGVLVNEWTHVRVSKTLSATLAPFSKICLFLIVMINSSAIAPYVEHITWELAAIIAVVFILALSGYAICYIVGKLIWKDHDLVTTFVFTGGMRNISAGVVLATTYFPGKVVMPVVFGMLFQQILASQFHRLLMRNERAA